MVEFLHRLWHIPFVWLKHLIKGPAVAVLGVILLLIGVIFATLATAAFWVMAVGIPLIAVGVSFIFYGIYDLIFGIISPHHQLIDCPFCQTQLKFRPKEIPTTCKNCGNKIQAAKPFRVT